jgi:hypothetical protein
MARVTEDGDIPRLRAAPLKLSASATATKIDMRWRRSIDYSILRNNMLRSVSILFIYALKYISIRRRNNPDAPETNLNPS